MIDKAPARFHPELDAALDAALKAPTPIVAKDRELIGMAQTAFEACLKECLFEVGEIRHQVIEREGKANVVVVARKTFDNLAVIGSFFDTPEASA